MVLYCDKFYFVVCLWLYGVMWLLLLLLLQLVLLLSSSVPVPERSVGAEEAIRSRRQYVRLKCCVISINRNFNSLNSSAFRPAVHQGVRDARRLMGETCVPKPNDLGGTCRAAVWFV